MLPLPSQEEYRETPFAVARRIRDARVETRTARLKLPIAKKTGRVPLRRQINAAKNTRSEIRNAICATETSGRKKASLCKDRSRRGVGLPTKYDVRHLGGPRHSGRQGLGKSDRDGRRFRSSRWHYRS